MARKEEAGTEEQFVWGGREAMKKAIERRIGPGPSSPPVHTDTARHTIACIPRPPPAHPEISYLEP